VIEGEAATGDRLRYWERLVLTLFGLMLASAGSGAPLGSVLRVGGWIVVVAALGFVEVLLAGYYRARRWLAA